MRREPRRDLSLPTGDGPLLIEEQITGTLAGGITLLLVGCLAALSAHSIRRRMPLGLSSLQRRTFFGIVAAAGLVAAVTGAAEVLVPGFVGAVVATLAGLTTAVTLWQRRLNERAALSQAIALGVQRGIPLDRLGVAFAQGRHDTLGGRAYLFAQSIHAGYAPAEAAAQAGLKLAPSVRTALAQPPAAAEPSTASPALPEAESTVDDTAGPKAALGAFYIAVLLVFAALLTTFLTIVVLPIFQEMRSEFGMEVPPWLATANASLAFVPAICLGALTAMVPVAILWWMLHAGWMAGGRWLPVLGPYYRHHQDAQALEWVADAIQHRRSLDWIEEEISRARIGPSERRLRGALARVRGGADWPAALDQMGLIGRRGLPWLVIAHSEERLARAIREIADARRRQAADALEMGFKIGGPIALLLVGIPVLLFGVALIGLLAHMILWLA